jgi:hypothetical protein
LRQELLPGNSNGKASLEQHSRELGLRVGIREQARIEAHSHWHPENASVAAVTLMPGLTVNGVLLLV